MAPGRGTARSCQPLLAFTTLLSIAALACLVAADAALLRGTIRVMDEIHDDGTELDVYHMDLPDGSWVHLDMDPSLRSKTARLRTGQQVVAEVASLPTQTTSVPSLFDSAFSVASLPRANPLTPGTSLQVMDIGPANAALSTSSVAARRLMARLNQAPPPSPSPAYTSPFPEYSNFFPRVLIVIIQNCDSVVARPIDMMDVFMEPTMGVAGYLNACSNGKVSLARKNVTAVAVSMCIDLHIDDSTCLDYRTVGDMALDIAVQNKKTLNVDSYRHILFIMPAYPSGCIMNTTGVVPPIGRGEVGGNKTWIRADGWTRLDVICHELQHNLNLMHAWIGDVEYADTSCIMGMTGTGLKCPNAPHSWQLRWSSAIGEITLANMGVGMVRNFTLPPAFGNEKNFIRIIDTTGDIYYINFRRFTSLYEQMPHQYDGNVMVYNFNQGRDDPYPTYLNATLSVGDAWKSNTWAVRFTHTHTDGTFYGSVDVSVCRLGPQGRCNALNIEAGAPGQQPVGDAASVPGVYPPPAMYSSSQPVYLAPPAFR